MDDFERELKIGFLAEAKQATADVEQCFLDLESNPDDDETINKIFRLAHNLKGSSKAVGFVELGDFTHEFESFILKVKNKELKANAKVINILLQGNDHVVKILDTLTDDLDARIEPIGLVQELKFYNDEAAPEETVLEAPKSEALDFEEPVFDDPEEVPAEIRQVFDLKADQFKEIDPVPLAVEIHTHEAPQKKSRPSAPVTDDTLRVSLQKVESLINFVGEMVILKSGLKEQPEYQNRPRVSPYRLATHLSLATVLYSGLLWNSFNLLIKPL